MKHAVESAEGKCCSGYCKKGVEHDLYVAHNRYFGTPEYGSKAQLREGLGLK